MTKLRLFSVLTLSGVLLLPGAAALGQDAPAESTPAATTAAEDTRLEELEQLVPPVLAGLPLDENLQLATGEELASVMSPEEEVVMADLLEANGKTVADYAAAATWLPLTDTAVFVLQAHRIAGVPAGDTIDAWVDIVSMNLAEPDRREGSIAGRSVTLVSDAADQEVPLLHMFPALDVVWMMWTDDAALVEAAMDAVDAESDEQAAE